MKALSPTSIITAVLLLATTGCAKPEAKNPFAARGTSARDGQVRVSVENQNFGDATVHALRGGERIRLGNVTGKTDEQFTVRWTFSLPMEFEIQIIGGQGCRIRPISVDPGDRIWVRIPVELSAQACYSGKG